ncbi:MAG: SRPBCC family protein [Candidatus Kariarchaeaceae archaeon]|jgi:uncharacterized protein YndB with AHSA1/START domain
MTFQEDPNKVKWKIHLKRSPSEVFSYLSTDEGRANFWAETAIEREEKIHFQFSNGYTWIGKIIENLPPKRFIINYIDNSRTTFLLAEDGLGGTELTLIDEKINPKYHAEVTAGWGSVLMALKAAVDFGVDLRNHDVERSWDQGYFDN